MLTKSDIFYFTGFVVGGVVTALPLWSAAWWIGIVVSGVIIATLKAWLDNDE